MARRSKKQDLPNVLLIAVDSLRADHMSCYGYLRLTTPHIDRFADQCTLFEQTYSAHIPTTGAYASMLTGRDCFATQVVALRHRGPMSSKVKTLAEILRGRGYHTTCVGFSGNPAGRGFDTCLNYPDIWGGWEDRPLRKAERLNDVAQPQIARLTRSSKPWFIMLRHMDPHAPYLPPPPYDRMFFHGNECDPKNKSMKPVLDFKPFCDFIGSWSPPGITDKDYLIAQYDGEIAYMDACLQNIFTQLETMGILDNTIVVLNGDHGETLYDHECWFDHHGLYDPVLYVPLLIRYPKMMPAGLRVRGYNQHKDLVPTILEMAGIKSRIPFEGRSLLPLVRGEVASLDSEFYINECTWMRKQGWRTPHWKLIVALEPDFKFKPPVELYNLVDDPGENDNVAKKRPDVVRTLKAAMSAHIRKRCRETQLRNPMMTQGAWVEGAPFKTSRQAYNKLHIASAGQARRLQAGQGK